MAKWSIRLLAGFTAILALLTLSCSMDLEPAKAGTTTVSFTVGAPKAASSSRAVAPGLGYLYIRTMGGPTGSIGPCYGPFPLESGATFTTKDIPAGTYGAIGLLYATKELDSLTAVWDGSTRTFTELMRLSDEEFALFTDGPEDSDGPSAFERLLDGYASAGMMENVTIKQNQKNQLSLTLVPACGDSGITMSENPELNVYTEAGNPDRLIRKYVRLDGVFAPTGYTLNNLTCTIRATGGIYVGSIALYDEDGILIGQREQVNAAISADTSVSRPWNGDDTFYLYVEYRGSALSLAFTSDMEGGEPPPVEPPPVEPPPVVIVPNEVVLDIVAGSVNANKKFIAGIYPYVAGGNPEGEPVAVMVLVLDENGNGTASFVDASTGSLHSFGSGAWTVSGMIDVNNDYSDILSGTNLTTTLGIDPHYGDYICDVQVTTNGTASVTRGIVASNFTVNDTYRYYVSQDGAGTRDGRRIANAMNIGDFSSLLTASSSLNIRAYALGGITFNSDDIWRIDNGNTVSLSSLDPGQIQTLMMNFNGSIDVNAGSILHLSDITIDGGSTTYSSPLVMLYGTLILADEARLQNRFANEAAGGLRVYEGGVLTMEEGSYISGCRGNQGGAIMMTSSNTDSPAVFNMTGGTITGCSATNSGGAIHASFASAITLSDGTISLCDGSLGGAVYLNGQADLEPVLNLAGTDILQCSANTGGAVYTLTESTISMTSGIIDTCTAVTNGGGFYLNGQTGAMISLNISGGTISNCGAGQYGGGVYVTGMYTTITMSGGSFDTCHAGYGGGIACDNAAVTLQSAVRFRSNDHAQTNYGWAIWYVQYSAFIPYPMSEPEAIQAFIENWDEEAVFMFEVV